MSVKTRHNALTQQIHELFLLANLPVKTDAQICLNYRSIQNKPRSRLHFPENFKKRLKSERRGRDLNPCEPEGPLANSLFSILSPLYFGHGSRGQRVNHSATPALHESFCSTFLALPLRIAMNYGYASVMGRTNVCFSFLFACPNYAEFSLLHLQLL
jgi:hypothetical protein